MKKIKSTKQSKSAKKITKKTSSATYKRQVPTWYGIDVHHIGLGVAAVGVLMSYVLISM